MSDDPVTLAAADPLATEAAEVVRAGDVDALRRLLAEHPELAGARLMGRRTRGGQRTLLHVFADWPGNRPNAREVVAVLAAAGADVDAPLLEGTHAETPLHWAASSDDVDLIDALLDAGADLEVRGAVIGGGTPLADATAFGQWRAAERLLERGARATFFEASVMGLRAQVEAALAATPGPDPGEVTAALWGACHGGRMDTAAILLEHGADVNWVGWDGLTPLDAAERTGAPELAAWLRARGGRPAGEL